MKHPGYLTDTFENWLIEKMNKSMPGHHFTISKDEYRQLGFANHNEFIAQYVDQPSKYDKEQFEQFLNLLGMGFSTKLGRPVVFKMENCHEPQHYALQWTAFKIDKLFRFSLGPMARAFKYEFKNHCSYCGKKLNGTQQYCSDTGLIENQNSCYEEMKSWDARIRNYFVTNQSKSSRPKTPTDYIKKFRAYCDEIFEFHEKQFGQLTEPW